MSTINGVTRFCKMKTEKKKNSDIFYKSPFLKVSKWQNIYKIIFKKLCFGRIARIGPHVEELITLKRTMRIKIILWTEIVNLVK